jgi:hypothetical protein
MKAEIPVLFFQENDKIVAYSPALDISTCGNTQLEAERRFTEAAAIFLQEIKAMGTEDEVLAECGWVKASATNPWSPPKYKTCREKLVSIPTPA